MNAIKDKREKYPQNYYQIRVGNNGLDLVRKEPGGFYRPMSIHELVEDASSLPRIRMTRIHPKGRPKTSNKHEANSPAGNEDKRLRDESEDVEPILSISDPPAPVTPAPTPKEPSTSDSPTTTSDSPTPVETPSVDLDDIPMTESTSGIVLGTSANEETTILSAQASLY